NQAEKVKAPLQGRDGADCFAYPTHARATRLNRSARLSATKSKRSPLRRGVLFARIAISSNTSDLFCRGEDGDVSAAASRPSRRPRCGIFISAWSKKATISAFHPYFLAVSPSCFTGGFWDRS